MLFDKYLFIMNFVTSYKTWYLTHSGIYFEMLCDMKAETLDLVAKLPLTEFMSLISCWWQKYAPNEQWVINDYSTIWRVVTGMESYKGDNGNCNWCIMDINSYSYPYTAQHLWNGYCIIKIHWAGLQGSHRGYLAKRALSAMRKHGW